MKCPIQTATGPDLFISYSAGKLPAHQEAELRSHLQHCEDCRMVAGAQAEIWSVLDEWEPLTVSPDFDRKLYARIAAEKQQPWLVRLIWYRPEWDWSFRPAMPVAAACTALVLAFLLKGPILSDQRQPEISMAQAQTERRTVDIERVERALDDVDMLKQLGVVTTAGQRPGPM